MRLGPLHCRGLPVFAVPGAYVTVPSQRGDIRFTPLFLSRQLLYDTVSGVQTTAARYVRYLTERKQTALLTVSQRAGMKVIKVMLS